MADALGNRRVTRACSGRTIGRLKRLCGFNGMNTIDRTSGCTIGPPRDMAYPVEPVGVETITPSASNWPAGRSSTSVSIRIRLISIPLCTTTSLSA